MTNSQIQDSVKIKIFIASASQSRNVVEALEHTLIARHIPGTAIEVIKWYKRAIRPTQDMPGELDRLANDCDLGIFVFSADDEVTRNGQQLKLVRDNVLFEYGLFWGRQGREQAIMLYDVDEKPDRASDIEPIQYVSYSYKKHGVLNDAIEEACNSAIFQHIEDFAEKKRANAKTKSRDTKQSIISHETFPESVFRKYLKTAKKIGVLQTWTPDIAFVMTSFGDFFQRNTAEINAYLLGPTNLARQRSVDLGHDAEWGIKRIKETIEDFESIQSQGKEKVTVKVRLYEKLPALAIYRCSSDQYDIAFVGFSFKGGRNIDNPFLEIDLNQDSNWREAIENEFEHMAADAKTRDDYSKQEWLA